MWEFIGAVTGVIALILAVIVERERLANEWQSFRAWRAERRARQQQGTPPPTQPSAPPTPAQPATPTPSQPVESTAPTVPILNLSDLPSADDPDYDEASFIHSLKEHEATLAAQITSPEPTPTTPPSATTHPLYPAQPAPFLSTTPAPMPTPILSVEQAPISERIDGFIKMFTALFISAVFAPGCVNMGLANVAPLGATVNIWLIILGIIFGYFYLSQRSWRTLAYVMICFTLFSCTMLYRYPFESMSDATDKATPTIVVTPRATTVEDNAY